MVHQSLLKNLKEVVTKTKGELTRTKGLLGRTENKIGTLNEEVHLQQQQLREEKKTSNATIAEARDRASDARKEAVRIVEAAQDTSEQVEEKVLSEQAAHRGVPQGRSVPKPARLRLVPRMRVKRR